MITIVITIGNPIIVASPVDGIACLYPALTPQTLPRVMSSLSQAFDRINRDDALQPAKLRLQQRRLQRDLGTLYYCLVQQLRF
jgi:hypothetical protein